MPLGAAAAGSPSRALSVIVLPALVDTSAVNNMIETSTKGGCTLFCSGHESYRHVRLVNFSHDIAATSFPSVISQVSACISTTANSECVRNHLSCLQKFAHKEGKCGDCICGNCWNGNVVYMCVMCERHHSSISMLGHRSS